MDKTSMFICFSKDITLSNTSQLKAADLGLLILDSTLHATRGVVEVVTLALTCNLSSYGSLLVTVLQIYLNVLITFHLK